jgi:chemotaxis protein CheC
MELTPPQRDALTELINIAFSRTAASLSELTGNRVELQVPEVGLYPIETLATELGRFVNGDVATVHQIFTGPVSGDALLLLNHDGAVRLVDLLTGTEAPTKRLGEAGKEVLSEVGNILLNACLGIFGDLLQVRFSFTVPRLHLEALAVLLGSLVIGLSEYLHHTLVVGAKFRLRNSEVTGCLVVVLGIASLDQLMQAVENWGEEAVAPPPPKPRSET